MKLRSLGRVQIVKWLCFYQAGRKFNGIKQFLKKQWTGRAYVRCKFQESFYKLPYDDFVKTELYEHFIIATYILKPEILLASHRFNLIPHLPANWSLSK